MPSSFKSLGKVLDDLSTCNSTFEEYCILEIGNIKVQDNSLICPKSCSILEYKATIDFWSYKDESYNHTATISMRYSPKVMRVYEEYLIYDLIGMTGSVGGTLGMFIGFSFYNVFLGILDFFQIITKLHKQRDQRLF